MKKGKETGLFFGSFDPVHIGHLVIADYLVKQGGLHKIIFVISPQNPFKTGQLLTPEAIRKEMLDMAIADNPCFSSSDIEFTMPAPHFTFSTLTELRKRNPSENYVLIIGSDNLEAFDRWKNYEEILANTQIIVYPRPGYEPQKFLPHPNITLVNAPLLNISSSFIRDSVQKGRPPKYMLPDKVLQFILNQELYK